MRSAAARAMAAAVAGAVCAAPAVARQGDGGGPVAPAPAGIDLYVSPAGNDAWSGRLAVASADKSDGPLASPGAAILAARKIRAAASALAGAPVDGAPAASPAQVGPITIVLRAGTYWLAQPLAITPEDSGEPGRPLVITAQKGAAVVLSGGAPIGPWRTVGTGDGRLWAANVPAAPPTQDASISSPWAFRELYINGKRRPRARHPNAGFLHIQDVPDVPTSAPWTDGKDYLRYREEDGAAWANMVGGEAVVMSRWVDSHLQVSAVNPATRIARFTRRAVLLLSTGDLYYLEGGLNLLDAPGEWFLDRGAGVVYYMRNPAEDPGAPITFDGQDAVGAVAPVLTRLLRVEGEPEAGKFVHDVELRGLTFSHAQWWFTDSSGKAAPEWSPTWPSKECCGFQQAAWGLPGAILVQGARGVVFDGCTVSHVGGYAIELGRGVRGCRITGCTLTDLGGGGVKIGETEIREKDEERTDHNEVSDTRIVGGGRTHHQAVGIWVGQSGDNLIAHNMIRELDYSGISLGWTWGYTASPSGGNIVEFNDVGWLGVHEGNTEPPLGDMGGIYTLGTQAGTVIRSNFFHDITGRTIAWGIYFDEGTSGAVAENNIVARTTHGGFHQHYGKDNVVRNNIFAFGRDAQLWKTRREEHTGFTFEKNIVYWRTGPLLGGDWAGEDYKSGSNIYCNAGEPIVFPGDRTLAQWQSQGREAGSRLADPMFIDATRDKFGLKDGSPALELGFVPIDLKDVGPRKRGK